MIKHDITYDNSGNIGVIYCDISLGCQEHEWDMVEYRFPSPGEIRKIFKFNPQLL